MGYVGNNGSASDSYFDSIGRRATKPSAAQMFLAASVYRS